MQRTCKTPIDRLKELMTRNGLKIMEIGTNHLRVFCNRKKLFDYREWHQLTYPTPFNGMGTWETEMQGIIDSLRS